LQQDKATGSLSAGNIREKRLSLEIVTEEADRGEKGIKKPEKEKTSKAKSRGIWLRLMRGDKPQQKRTSEQQKEGFGAQKTAPDR